MSPAAVVERVDPGMLSLWPAEAPERAPEPAARVRPDSAARTLAEAVDGAWSALDSGFASDCLLCGGAVHPRWSAGAGVVGGRCSSCGTDLD